MNDVLVHVSLCAFACACLRLRTQVCVCVRKGSAVLSNGLMVRFTSIVRCGFRFNGAQILFAEATAPRALSRARCRVALRSRLPAGEARAEGRLGRPAFRAGPDLAPSRGGKRSRGGGGTGPPQHKLVREFLSPRPKLDICQGLWGVVERVAT